MSIPVQHQVRLQGGLKKGGAHQKVGAKKGIQAVNRKRPFRGISKERLKRDLQKAGECNRNVLHPCISEKENVERGGGSSKIKKKRGGREKIGKNQTL